LVGRRVTAIPLRLGPLEATGQSLKRSGLRWLCDDGRLCRAHEIVAFCNIGLRGAISLFPDEDFDLQVGFAPRVAGRIRRVAAASFGGYLDRIPNIPWSPDDVWAYLEPLSDDSDGPLDEPDLLFLAGRRFTGVSEDRSGLLTGWHDRTRAWWGDGQGATLLAAGTCQQEGLIRGDDGSFSCMFEMSAGPAQVVLTHGEPLVPCAAVLRQQLTRTSGEAAAIRQDMAATFFADDRAPVAAGWLFMGALLNGLERSLLDQPYDLLTRSGLQRAPPASAICLSAAGEGPHLLRHRRLGYVLNIHAYRLAGIGPVMRNWLQRNFEPVSQSIDDVARDYRLLVAAHRDRPFFLVNRISSHVNETIQSYDALDDATMAGLGSLRANELNLMLHDLAREPNVEIIDADAIAADLGIAGHLPDGMHPSGDLQREIRAELLRSVRARGLAGFAPRAVSRS
jgi:hypothetical protein